MSIFKPQPVPKRKRGRPRKNPPVAPGTAPGLVGRPRVKPFGPKPPRVRKPREPGVARPRVAPVRLSEDEHAAFKRVADAVGIPLSAWIRSTLLREVKFFERSIPNVNPEDRHLMIERALGRDTAGLYDTPVVLRDMSPEELREQANNPKAFTLGPRMPGVVTAEGTFVQTPDGIIKT